MFIRAKMKILPMTPQDDDEFEEFAAEDWQDEAGEPKGSSAVLWDDNWDEEDQEDTFSEQLRYNKLLRAPTLC